jgi:hypothetical protein
MMFPTSVVLVTGVCSVPEEWCEEGGGGPPQVRLPPLWPVLMLSFFYVPLQKKRRRVNITKKQISTIKMTKATIRTSVGDPLGLPDPDSLVRDTDPDPSLFS